MIVRPLFQGNWGRGWRLWCHFRAKVEILRSNINIRVKIVLNFMRDAALYTCGGGGTVFVDSNCFTSARKQFIFWRWTIYLRHTFLCFVDNRKYLIISSQFSKLPFVVYPGWHILYQFRQQTFFHISSIPPPSPRYLMVNPLILD